MKGWTLGVLDLTADCGTVDREVCLRIVYTVFYGD